MSEPIRVQRATVKFFDGLEVDGYRFPNGEFRHRSDSLMDLLDALCSARGAKSVAELSLNSRFRRGYSALYVAIKSLGKLPCEESIDTEALNSRFPTSWVKMISQTVPAPEHRNYWLFGVDVTPVVRCHSMTLKDRECVYQPTVVAGVKPISVGHNYSLMSVIPETQVAGGRSWIVPVSIERVTSFESKTGAGSAQVERLLSDESLPWHQDLCVLVADSEYSHRGFLYPSGISTNRAIVTRCRSNRVFYRLPEKTDRKRRGHPRWYGIRFSKQHLMMTQLQTPDVTTSERWIQFCVLAYAQLWVARSLAQLLPNPWQRYLPAFQQGQSSPSLVQRDFSRIIQHIGTPAAPVKPRGKSPGRREGFTLKPRPRRPIVKRGRPRPKKRQKAA